MVKFSKREDWELQTLLDSLRASRVVRFRSLEYWQDDGWVEDGMPVNPEAVEKDFQKEIGAVLVEGTRHKVFIMPAMSHYADPLRESMRKFLGEEDE